MRSILLMVSSIALLLAGRVTAQNFTTLHSFGGGLNDGDTPRGGLIVKSNALYGTTIFGGSMDQGVLFKINTNGTDYTNFYSFNGGLDGRQPSARLVSSSNVFFGTTGEGGEVNRGTVFVINTDGTGFTNLYSFTGTNDGYYPTDLTLFGNVLYGTTAFSSNDALKGNVFRIKTDGSGYTNLYNFPNTNDGASPFGGLLLSANALYGTTHSGG